MLSKKAIVFDTETTGLYPGKDSGDEILTISVIDRNGACLFDGRYRPRWRKKWPEASRVDGIWPKDVRDLPTITADIPRLREIFGAADQIAGYNVWFDLGFVEVLGVEFEEKKVRVPDPMEEFAEEWGEWSDYFEDYKWKNSRSPQNTSATTGAGPSARLPGRRPRGARVDQLARRRQGVEPRANATRHLAEVCARLSRLDTHVQQMEETDGNRIAARRVGLRQRRA